MADAGFGKSSSRGNDLLIQMTTLSWSWLAFPTTAFQLILTLYSDPQARINLLERRAAKAADENYGESTPEFLSTHPSVSFPLW